MLQVRGNLTQALKRFQSDFRNISVMASDATLRLTGSVRTPQDRERMVRARGICSRKRSHYRVVTFTAVPGVDYAFVSA